MNEVYAIKDIDKIRQIRNVLRNKSLRDELLFILGINVGLRISDILKLKKADLFMCGCIKESVEIIEQKTNKSKIFYLSPVVRKLIIQYIKINDVAIDEYIFKSREGLNKPITRQQVWRILNDAAIEVGINDKIGTHTLRKTFGYHAYKNGISLELLMRIFNHYSKADTLRYIGITQDDIRGVYINSNLG